MESLKHRFAQVDQQLQIIAQQLNRGELADLCIIQHATRDFQNSIPRAVDVSSIEDIHRRDDLYMRFFALNDAVKKLPKQKEQRSTVHEYQLCLSFELPSNSGPS